MMMMGGGDPPPPPAAPDYAKANREAIEADIETLPERRKIDAQSKLGLGEFAGLGDADLTRSMAVGEADAAKTRAQYTLDIQKSLGPQFVQNQTELVKQSDPLRWQANQDYVNDLLADFKRGGELDPTVAREVEQTTRGAQAARGNILGNAAAFQEAMQVGQASEARKERRKAGIQSYLGLNPVSAQFGAINQAQGPAPVNGQMYSGIGLNPNAGQLGTDFASKNYATAANIWSTQAQIQANKPTGFDMAMQGVGALGSIAGMAMI
jgi:hypothetical protein